MCRNMALWNTCTRMAERQTSHGGRGNCYSSSVLSLEQWLLSVEEQHQGSQLWRFLRVRTSEASCLPLTVLWRKRWRWSVLWLCYLFSELGVLSRLSVHWNEELTCGLNVGLLVQLSDILITLQISIIFT